VGTVCSDPPSIAIGVRPDRHSHGLIAEHGEFVINLPRADQVKAVDYCGHASGRDLDKWAACGLTAAPPIKIRTPLVEGCPIALECRVSHRLALGSHDLFIGEVVCVQADEGVLNAQGAVDYERAQLMTYVGGYYRRVSDALGRYGDWRTGV
jgi:flavin reductase (DIM6/NTAB) family NADH-FMN oxidoreductase RutF